MVKLTEVEDEHFVEKPATTGDEVLLASDDEDYTDTDSEISDSSDLAREPEESLTDRIAALRDILPPKARARLSSATSSLTSFTGSALTFSGKALWVVSTSMMLLGIPWALAVGQEQELLEREREETMMREGNASMLDPGSGGQAKAAL